MTDYTVHSIHMYLVNEALEVTSAVSGFQKRALQKDKKTHVNSVNWQQSKLIPHTIGHKLKVLIKRDTTLE